MNVLDEVVISGLKELMDDDYVFVYEAFVISADQAMIELNEAVKTNNIKSVEIIVHTLKGSSANIGAKKFSELCSGMLEEARYSVTENFGVHLNGIVNEYKKVNESIMNLLNKS